MARPGKATKNKAMVRSRNALVALTPGAWAGASAMAAREKVAVSTWIAWLVTWWVADACGQPRLDRDGHPVAVELQMGGERDPLRRYLAARAEQPAKVEAATLKAPAMRRERPSKAELDERVRVALAEITRKLTAGG